MSLSKTILALNLGFHSVALAQEKPCQSVLIADAVKIVEWVKENPENRSMGLDTSEIGGSTVSIDYRRTLNLQTGAACTYGQLMGQQTPCIIVEYHDHGKGYANNMADDIVGKHDTLELRCTTPKYCGWSTFTDSNLQGYVYCASEEKWGNSLDSAFVATLSGIELKPAESEVGNLGNRELQTVYLRALSSVVDVVERQAK